MVIHVNFSRFPKILAPPFRPESEIFLARYGSKLAGGALGNYLVPIYRFPPAQQTAVQRGEPSLPPFFFLFPGQVSTFSATTSAAALRTIIVHDFARRL